MGWPEQWRSSESYRRAMAYVKKRLAEIDQKERKMDRLTIFWYIVGAALFLFGTVIGPALLALTR